jgi:DNA-binding NarL/FixJ family response regulator
MIKVMVVDDHTLVRQGIRLLLERANDIEVIGEAADGLEAVEKAQRLKPDVVVMDIVMPLLNGPQAAERIRLIEPAPQVVLLSMHADATLLHQALQAGIRGYLLKRSVAEELLTAVRAASRNETYFSPALLATISDIGLQAAQPNSNAKSDRALLEQLTTREVEVLKLICAGHTNQRVGAILGLSEKTIEKHRASLMDKLSIHYLPGLVRFAIKHKIIELDA